MNFKQKYYLGISSCLYELYNNPALPQICDIFLFEEKEFIKISLTKLNYI